MSDYLLMMAKSLRLIIYKYTVFKVHFTAYLFSFRCSGDGEIRTHDPLLARQVLSQLSYTPVKWVEMDSNHRSR